ncbi:hypothetical protein K3495_g14942 [Podosphaera aphanis]|nr:hypothetical protein K3495_g14942 [Podosphaera aphanis]
MNTQITPPVSRRAPYLTRDQRLQILTLHRAGLSNREIADQLEVTILQVRNTVRSGRACPQPRTERSQLLSSAQVDELEAFVCSSRETRQISLLELALHSRRWSAGEHAIRNALRKRGHERRIPRNSLPLSENHRAVRIWWSEQHLNWRQEWSQVLWSDETRINDSRIMSGYVTRKVSLIFFIFKNISVSIIVKRVAKTLMTLLLLIVTRRTTLGCSEEASRESNEVLVSLGSGSGEVRPLKDIVNISSQG